jgi:hypothetical protein
MNDHMAYHIEDCKRIAEVAIRHGVPISLEAAYSIWNCVSDQMSAGWLLLPKSGDVLYSRIKQYLANLSYRNKCPHCGGIL